MKTIRREHRSFLILLALYIFSATFMLNRYPRVWVDEPWNSITGYTLAADGKMYNPILENTAGFDRIFLQPRLMLSLAVAPIFKLFGVGYLQGRLVSAVCGALFILAVYLLSTRLFSRRTALLAVWFVIIETMMFICFRTIRDEAYLVMFEGFSLVFFFKGLKSQSTKDFFWSGLTAGLALWTHPNAILHVSALAVVLLLSYKKDVLASRASWAFLGAVAVGVAPYLVYVIANDAHNSFSTFYLQLGDRTNSLSRQNWIFTSLRGEWERIVEYAQVPYRVPIILIYIIVWLSALVSKRWERRYIAIIICVHAALSFLLITNKTIYYSTSVLPLFCILAASGIDELLGESQTVAVRLKRFFMSLHVRETVGVCVFLILSLNQLAGDASLLWRSRNCSYEETVQRLQAVIPPDARVWGSMTFWFGFHRQPYRTQYTYLKDLDTFRPEYMITGDPEVWGKESWKPIRDSVEQTVRLRGTLVSQLPPTCYGELRVYRLRW